MSEDKELTQQESLGIIQQMINAAKQQQKDDGKSWIVWGWILFAASLLTVANLSYKWYNPFFFWNVFGMVSVFLLIAGFTKQLWSKKSAPVKTYTGELFKKLNAGFFISLWFIIIFMNIAAKQVTEWYVIINAGFALLVNLYAFWILVYGSAMNFKPSIIGAYITWAIAFVMLFMHTFEQVMLLHGLAVLCGYIIPGHIASIQFNKLRREDKV
ncbi:hypothetical protein BH09BAC2_BH09BAC2_18040 [soil metagenome]